MCTLQAMITNLSEEILSSQRIGVKVDRFQSEIDP